MRTRGTDTTGECSSYSGLGDPSGELGTHLWPHPESSSTGRGSFIDVTAILGKSGAPRERAGFGNCVCGYRADSLGDALDHARLGHPSREGLRVLGPTDDDPPRAA